MATCSLPFASKSLTEHIVRGVIGAVAVAFAIDLGGTRPLIAIALLVGSLVALRGCPMCWLTGLFTTLQQNRPRPDKEIDPRAA